MSLVYSTEYRTPVDNEVFRRLLTCLPPALATRTEKYRRWQDAYASLFGKLLLTAALKDLNITADLRHLQYTSYGRPFLPDAPDFNISHSGHRVVCIVASRGRIGIDLEEIKELNIQDFKDQFSPDEWKTIQKAADPLPAFYHYWTAKECLSKADGRGLNLPLADLNIADGATFLLDNTQWILHTFPHFPHYACHVATEFAADELSLKEIDINLLSINNL